MMHLKIPLLLLLALLASSCSENEPANSGTLSFTDIRSDFSLENLNGYNCQPINKGVLQHVFSTGVEITGLDIHDYYANTGCSVSGSVKVNNQIQNFTFEYGGYIRLDDELIIGCAEKCCENNFKYCTYEKH